MGNFAKAGKDWRPLHAKTLFKTQTNPSIVCMEHKQTREHAYFDIKLNRFLSQQEALDVVNGNYG